MGAPAAIPPFSMPMFREFVPEKIRPWIYIFLAFTFQFSGGLYLGTLSQMMGDTALMREDLMMCLYANLAGMAIYFPLLFRMKFRFTNKTLLTAAAFGVLACNLITPHIRFLPLLWTVCFVEGICKIQGTFECLSNVQLWITPKRDFRVFFPVLHIIILGSMQMSGILSTWLAYWFSWEYMQLFISGLMLIDLLILHTCTRFIRFIRKTPLYGIDWIGALLWALLLLEISFFFCYGSWYDWLHSPVMCSVGVAIIVTLFFCVARMLKIRHPYLEPKMWKYRRLAPLLILITVIEVLLATENGLEKIYYGSVMHYASTVSVNFNWVAMAGCIAGCLFSMWWMKVMGFSFLRLIIVGIAALGGYLAGFYFTMSSDIHMSQLYIPIALRGFAYATLSATFFVCLEEIMTFQHFFQSLSVFNMLHLVMGGVLGGAIYTRGMSYYMPDNLARYGAAIDATAFSRATFHIGEFMESFIPRIMEISIKQLYGWTLYACILLFLLFLLYDTPIRSNLKSIPSWNRVWRLFKERF